MRKQCKRKKYYAAPSIAFIRGQKEVGDDRALTFWIKTEYAWGEIRLGQDVYADNYHFKHVSTTIMAAFFCLQDPLLAKNRTLDRMREVTEKAALELAEATKRSAERYDANNEAPVRFTFKQLEHASITRFFESFGSVHAMIPYDAWHLGWNLAANELDFKELMKK